MDLLDTGLKISYLIHTDSIILCQQNLFHDEMDHPAHTHALVIIILTEGRHQRVLRLEAPGGGVDARVGVLHPEVVLVRPSVIVDLEER